MDFFQEIAKEKKDFPKIKTVTNEVSKIHLNFYQIFAIVIFIVCLVLGILLGNIFSTCQTSSYFYSNSCIVREFNFSLMIFIWFFGLLVSVFFYGIGHIIYYLGEILKKINKNDE